MRPEEWNAATEVCQSELESEREREREKHRGRRKERKKSKMKFMFLFPDHYMMILCFHFKVEILFHIVCCATRLRTKNSYWILQFFSHSV